MVPRLYGETLNRRDLAARSGSLSQFAGVRLSTLGDGVESLEIWLVGDRMFMLMEQDTDRAPNPETKRARDTANPEVAAWDTLMASFQKSLPFAPGQTWVEMERVYALSEQA